MFGLFFIIKRILSIFLVNVRLWKEDEQFRALVVILAAIILSGTVFYSIMEKWSIIDSIYFCIMTIATIGYGDLAPTTPLSKIFTIIMALSGIGVFVGIVTKLARGLTQKSLEKRHKHEVENNKRDIKSNFNDKF